MKKNIKQNTVTILGVLGAILVPVIAFAAPSNFAEFVGVIMTGVLKPLIAVIVTLALAYFLWGMANFILHADDEQARSKGKQVMVWGIIALFVLIQLVPYGRQHTNPQTQCNQPNQPP